MQQQRAILEWNFTPKNANVKYKKTQSLFTEQILTYVTCL